MATSLDTLQSQAIQLTEELIALPSESSGTTKSSQPPEAAVCAFLCQFFTTHHISFSLQEISQGRHNIIARLPGPSSSKLLFLAHMDTVGAGSMPTPFTPQIVDRRIIGRGACDAKGPLASLLSVLAGMKNEIKKHHDCTLVCTVGEEVQMIGSATFARTLQQSYDLCLALEPSRLLPIDKHIGIYRCRIFPNNSPQKTSTDAKKNICDILATLKHFQEQTEAVTDPDLGRPVVTLTPLGTSFSPSDSGPDRILVDIRMLPEQSPSLLHQQILDCLGSRGRIVPLVAGHGLSPAAQSQTRTNFLNNLQHLGHESRPIAVHFPSDCSQIPTHIPALVWGPGNPDLAHTDNESISFKQLRNACAALAHFLVNP